MILKAASKYADSVCLLLGIVCMTLMILKHAKEDCQKYVVDLLMARPFLCKIICRSFF